MSPEKRAMHEFSEGTLDLGKLSQQTAQQVYNALSKTLSEEERAQISEIIDKALANSVGETMEEFTETAIACCGPEADIAHKISEETRLAKIALIANLGGMR